MKKLFVSAVAAFGLAMTVASCGGGGGDSGSSSGTTTPTTTVSKESIQIADCSTTLKSYNDIGETLVTPEAFTQNLSGADLPNPKEVDAFFDEARFIGAVDPRNNWMEGWTFGFGKAPYIPKCTEAEVIQGNITSNLTLEGDKCYRIKGKVAVKEGATLTIKPGALIYGDRAGGTFDYLVVERGGKLIAEGTKEKPILFVGRDFLTKCDMRPGQWGGIVIAGRAENNVGIDALFEADKDIRYGGKNDDDSSGSLRYVVVAFGGAEVAPNEEVNGITFLSTGRGTKVEYVQVYNNADDAFEWFGGTTDAKYIVAAGNMDDNIDTDHGYRGRIQYAYIVQSSANGSADVRGIEADNNPTNNAANPRSFLKVANLTIVTKASRFFSARYDEAIMLRRGTDFQLVNALVAGRRAGACLRVDEQAAYDAINNPNNKNGKPAIQGLVLASLEHPNDQGTRLNCGTPFAGFTPSGQTKTGARLLFEQSTTNRDLTGSVLYQIRP